MSTFQHPVNSKLDIVNIHQYKQSKFANLLACIAVALAVSSCGGTGQDKGTATAESNAVSGLAIDGYLARALVFIDYDNNKTRDPWEPYAFTDDDGYFSFNQKTNANYCAANASESEKTFCLQTTRTLKDVIIRIDGGYDVMTGEPFYGQLSRRVTDGTPGLESPLIVSPITSLLAEARSESARNAVLAALDLQATDLDEDYLDAEGVGINHKLLNTALKLHKSVSLISQAIGENYSELGSQVGAMNDASATVYKHLARQLTSNNRNLDSLTADPTLIAQMIAAIELEVLDYYDQWEIPAPLQQTETLNAVSLADSASALSQLINTLLDAQISDNPDMVMGSIKLIEAMAIKSSGAAANSSALRSSVNFLLDNQNRTLLNELVASLAESNSDLVNVANLDLTDSALNSREGVRSASQLPPETNAFRNLAGQQMRVSDMDLGSAPNSLRDSEIEFYFHGDEGDTRGSFSACVKYIKDASVSGKLGDANTRGELVSGYWSLLGANRNNGASYSLLLTIKFLGTRYQAILKPAGSSTFNGAQMSGIRFDYGNELRTWYSQEGLEPIQYSPTTAADCAARLPSRIGL